MSIIKLQSSDGDIFSVDLQAAKCSSTIQAMLNRSSYSADEADGAPIPLVHVKSHILRKVIEWANYHQDDAPVAEDEILDPTSGYIPTWDRLFFRVDQATLFELIGAARYLNIEGLLDLALTTLANMIKGKNEQEIRKTFNIVNDFTPAEEEQVRKENEWCLYK